MGHGDVSLGGPVWLFAQVLILFTVVLALFVFVDSFMPRRKTRVAGRLPEPLWMYSVTMGTYLAVLVTVQIIPGLQIASAVAAIATPFALALAVTYLLRAVFPKPETGSAGETPKDVDDSSATGGAAS